MDIETIFNALIRDLRMASRDSDAVERARLERHLTNAEARLVEMQHSLRVAIGDLACSGVRPVRGHPILLPLQQAIDITLDVCEMSHLGDAPMRQARQAATGLMTHLGQALDTCREMGDSVPASSTSGTSLNHAQATV
jgi:hypothetical protein